MSEQRTAHPRGVPTGSAYASTAAERIRELWALGTEAERELRAPVITFARQFQRHGQTPEALLRTLKHLMPLPPTHVTPSRDYLVPWDGRPGELRSQLVTLAITAYYGA